MQRPAGRQWTGPNRQGPSGIYQRPVGSSSRHRVAGGVSVSKQRQEGRRVQVQRPLAGARQRPGASRQRPRGRGQQADSRGQHWEASRQRPVGSGQRPVGRWQ